MWSNSCKASNNCFFFLVFCNMPTAFVIRSTKSLKCMCTCKLVWIVLLWVPTWQQNMWVHWASKWAVSDQAEVKIKSCECRQCQREFVCICVMCFYLLGPQWILCEFSGQFAFSHFSLFGSFWIKVPVVFTHLTFIFLLFSRAVSCTSCHAQKTIRW